MMALAKSVGVGLLAAFVVRVIIALGLPLDRWAGEAAAAILGVDAVAATEIALWAVVAISGVAMVAVEWWVSPASRLASNLRDPRARPMTLLVLAASAATIAVWLFVWWSYTRPALTEEERASITKIKSVATQVEALSTRVDALAADGRTAGEAKATADEVRRALVSRQRLEIVKDRINRTDFDPKAQKYIAGRDNQAADSSRRLATSFSRAESVWIGEYGDYAKDVEAALLRARDRGQPYNRFDVELRTMRDFLTSAQNRLERDSELRERTNQ